MSDDDRAILTCRDWTPRGQKVLAQDLGISTTRLAQRALRLADSPEAEAAYPVEVHRLRRLRERNRGRR